MIAVKGLYKDGNIKLSKNIQYNKEIEVIVTFLDDENKDDKYDDSILNIDDFSFNRAQNILKEYKGDISDALLEERRSYL